MRQRREPVRRAIAKRRTRAACVLSSCPEADFAAAASCAAPGKGSCAQTRRSDEYRSAAAQWPLQTKASSTVTRHVRRARYGVKFYGVPPTGSSAARKVFVPSAVRAVATWPSELTDVEFLSVWSSSPLTVGRSRWVRMRVGGCPSSRRKTRCPTAARVIVIKTKMDVNYDNIIIIITYYRNQRLRV